MLRPCKMLVMAALVAGACSDALEQTSSAGQVIGFVPTNTPLLELISPGRPAATSVPLENPGSIGQSSIAGRGSVFIVALAANLTTTVNIVNLDPRSATVVDTLVFNDAIVGVTIQDDSIAWLSSGNPPGVLRVNYPARVATRIPLSGTPGGLVITSGKVFVVNTNVVVGQGPGPSWISVVDIVTNAVTDSVPLTGRGAYSLTLGGDSMLYGIAGADGKVSIVDPVALRELAVINGLGIGASRAAWFHPSGRLLIPSIADGILEVNTLTRALTRGPENGVKPGGREVLSLALDNAGRVYAAIVGCGIVHVLTGPPEYRNVRAVSVLGCPVAAATAVSP